MNEIPHSESVRLTLLRELAKSAADIGVQVPRFSTISNRQLPSAVRPFDILDWVESSLSHIRAQTEQVSGEGLITRACPIDEGVRPDLSFAGVYQTYHPYRYIPRERQIRDGLHCVLEGRFSAYADYYYSRHNIRGSRVVDLMFMEIVDGACMCGTAYVHSGRCLLHYYDTPLSHYQRDPIIVAALPHTRLSAFHNRLVRSFVGAERLLGAPLDIEFIVDRNLQIHVVQARPISARHLGNWSRIEEPVWERATETRQSSTVINTVGRCEGRVVDLRNAALHLSYFEDTTCDVYLVRHTPSPSGVDALALLRFANAHNLSGLSLLVHHDRVIRSDHLMYIMAEDPGVAFVASIVDLDTDRGGDVVRIESDGFDIRLTP